jgi:signal peptidase
VEITAKPRRRGRRRAVRLLLAAVAVASVVLLLPPALGLSAHVVADEAMAGTHTRGSVVLDEPVPMGQLAVGDVVTFTEPGGEGFVTRRVVAISEDGVQTRGDAGGAPDPWRVSPDAVERVRFEVPLLGWPVIVVDALSVPPWTPAALLLGLALLLVLLRRTTRRTPDPEPRAALPEGVPAAQGGPPAG